MNKIFSQIELLGKSKSDARSKKKVAGAKLVANELLSFCSKFQKEPEELEMLVMKNGIVEFSCGINKTIFIINVDMEKDLVEVFSKSEFGSRTTKSLLQNFRAINVLGTHLEVD